MAKSRIVGWLICLASLLFAALFLWGIYQRSYWAIAIPVIMAVLGALLLVFWIGWTMAVTEAEVSGPSAKEESPPGST